MFFIKRNTSEFGPFDVNQIKSGYKSGNILKRDLIRHDKTDNYISIEKFFELNNIELKQKEEGFSETFLNVVKLNTVFISPFKYLNIGENKNYILFLLLAIVLTPLMALFFSEVPILSYSIYGVYFASIWGLILYKVIAPNQADLKLILIISSVTVLSTFIFIELFHSTSLWLIIEGYLDSQNILLSFISMLFGVAIVEEFLKQSCVYITILNGKNVMPPRIAIFYGMIAGLAFGIYEGVEYQMIHNKSLETDYNYYYNIIRLTSLPFFHAMWSGIGAYFISLSFIELKYKYSFRIMGLLIPSFLHASYNTFGLTFFGISIIIITSILLTVYLTKSDLVAKQLNSI